MPTAAEYREQLKQLLPPGQAFPRDPGTTLHDLLDGMSIELARVDARGFALPVEVNPSTTLELLSDWERVTGLPDRCSGVLEETIQGRRNAVLAKLSGTGGQSAPYFISVAAALGYQVTITEFHPFRVGRSRVGDALTNGAWQFAWQINAPETTAVSFRVGLSAVGEALRTWGAGSLECKIRQLAPAHTVPIFAYAGSSLDLLFDSGTYLLNQQTSSFASLVTFTRAGAGGRWNAAGVYEMIATNLPRFGYDPVTRAPLGLLIEEARTNLLTYSSDLTNAAWSKTDATISASSEVAPDGATMQLVSQGSAGTAFIARTANATVVAGFVTHSFVAKKSNNDWLRCRLVDAIGAVNGGEAWFNIATGVVGNVANRGTGTGTRATINDVGNGRYECSITVVMPGTTAQPNYQLVASNGATAPVSLSSFCHWGAQIEQGGFKTSHIPTTAATVTRPPDVANVNDLAPWINAVQGTLYVEYAVNFLGGQGFPGPAALASAAPTSGSRIGFFVSDSGTDNLIANVRESGGATQVQFSGPVAASGVFYKQGLAYKQNDFAGSFNGGAVLLDTSGTVPAVTRLRIGNFDSGQLNGTIRRLRYYPRRLTNDELQALTTS